MRSMIIQPDTSQSAPSMKKNCTKSIQNMVMQIPLILLFHFPLILLFHFLLTLLCSLNCFLILLCCLLLMILCLPWLFLWGLILRLCLPLIASQLLWILWFLCWRFHLCFPLWILSFRPHCLLLELHHLLQLFWLSHLPLFLQQLVLWFLGFQPH